MEPRVRVPARGLRCRIPVVLLLSDDDVIELHFDTLPQEYKLSACNFLRYMQAFFGEAGSFFVTRMLASWRLQLEN